MSADQRCNSKCGRSSEGHQLLAVLEDFRERLALVFHFDAQSCERLAHAVLVRIGTASRHDHPQASGVGAGGEFDAGADSRITRAKLVCSPLWWLPLPFSQLPQASFGGIALCVGTGFSSRCRRPSGGSDGEVLPPRLSAADLSGGQAGGSRSPAPRLAAPHLCPRHLPLERAIPPAGGGAL